jgi:hypothetical protein
MRRPFQACVVIALLLTGGQALLPATVTVPIDLSELVAQASLIVYGRVIDARGVVTDGGTETLVTLTAPAYLKGGGGPEVVFRVPGGTIGRYRTVVVGAPVFERGDEVVVFLRPGADGVPVVVGFSQGALHVVRDRDTAVPMVLSPPLARDDRAVRVARGDTNRRFVALSSFVTDVRALAAGAGRGTSGRQEPSGPARKPGGY